MATVRVTKSQELQSGDRMTREEFHRAYEQMPEDFRAELIGGVVYVASPLRRPHAVHHINLGALFVGYAEHTPGVEAGDNATILLGNESEPQPDLYLRILPEWGGQSRTSTDEYIEGAPELLAEVAHSSRALDLHAKREDYRRCGVLEYLVLIVGEQRLRWFDLRQGDELSLDADAIVRARTFPGLWIQVEALLARDLARLRATLEQGLATREHADFLVRLAARRGADPR